MRLVTKPSDFLEALHSCKRESLNAFGNDTVILEKFLVNPRHVEVQICCDSHGNAVYLHERDCSVQRRHQKVLEEAPAPGLSEGLRRELGEVAVRAAKAVGYVNAGTVEFLMDENKEFYFCEMNTRLQVEHPVTEFITGVDLVEWQLKVAAGEELPTKNQPMIPCNGHAIECRIYAENPAKGFLPAAGILRHLRPPPISNTVGGGVRVDTGVVQGDKISVFYDPMISKLIVHAQTRKDAINKLLLSLRSYQIVGTPTNLKFVEKCVDHPAFRKGGVNTGFLEYFADDVKVLDEVPLPSAIGLCLASLAVLLSMEGRIGIVNKHIHSPWSKFSGSWRLGVPYTRKLNFTPYLGFTTDAAADIEQGVICVSNKDGSYTISLVGDCKRYQANGVLHEDGTLEAVVDGKHYKNVTAVELNEDDNAKSLHLWAAPGRFLGKEGEYSISVCLPSIVNQKLAATEGTGIIKAPMPGKVGT
jgi:3-methylcrotonyl-CoA carboxylase alpha subunit